MFSGDGVQQVVMCWRFGGPCPKTDQESVLQKQFVWQSIKVQNCILRHIKRLPYQWTVGLPWKKTDIFSDIESTSEKYKNWGGCLTDGQTEDDAQTPSNGEPEGSYRKWTHSDTTISGFVRWPRLLYWNAYSKRCCNGSLLWCAVHIRNSWKGNNA